MELCPSPPSGAACLCQDVSLHIVMKGVIKVTAGWKVAYSSSSSPLPLYPSALSLVAHIVCLCMKPVSGNQQFSSNGVVSVRNDDILLSHLIKQLISKHPLKKWDGFDKAFCYYV